MTKEQIFCFVFIWANLSKQHLSNFSGKNNFEAIHYILVILGHKQRQLRKGSKQ